MSLFLIPIDLDFSMTPEIPMIDLLSEDILQTPSVAPDFEDSAPKDETGALLIVPVPPGTRKTYFFFDHTRRLAVTHYQTEPTPTDAEENDSPSASYIGSTVTPQDSSGSNPAAPAGPVPQFLLKFYIRSNVAMFNSRENLQVILGWCEKLFMLSAINNLLHKLGLSGTSIRLEMYDGLGSFEAIIAHSRNEQEHHHMVTEFLDCEKEIKLAKLNVHRGNFALHPAVHPRVGCRFERLKLLQRSIRDYETAKRHLDPWNPPPNVIALEKAATLPSPCYGSMQSPTFPAHATLVREETSSSASSPSPAARPPGSPDRPATDTTTTPQGFRTTRRPPGPPTTPTLPPAPFPPIRIAKPGSPLNPLRHSTDPMAPASFLLFPHQPYHHAVLVLDEYAWQSRGLVLLKFDREKDWADMADAVGSLGEGDYVAERVSCFEHGRVEQRAAERNTPERMKVVRIGERQIEEKMEVVSKRWLGEVFGRNYQRQVFCASSEPVGLRGEWELNSGELLLPFVFPQGESPP